VRSAPNIKHYLITNNNLDLAKYIFMRKLKNIVVCFECEAHLSRIPKTKHITSHKQLKNKV
jgi:ribosomal protein L34E